MPRRTPTLTRKDVARRAAALRNAPLYQAEPWVGAVLEALTELMVEADPDVRIELRDFGVLEVKRTRARPAARNPRTNEPVFVPSRRKTHFRPGKRLRDALDRPLSELGYDAPAGSAEPPGGGQRR
jgi:integration host factor subunit beta